MWSPTPKPTAVHELCPIGFKSSTESYPSTKLWHQCYLRKGLVGKGNQKDPIPCGWPLCLLLVSTCDTIKGWNLPQRSRFLNGRCAPTFPLSHQLRRLRSGMPRRACTHFEGAVEYWCKAFNFNLANLLVWEQVQALARQQRAPYGAKPTKQNPKANFKFTRRIPLVTGTQ